MNFDQQAREIVNQTSVDEGMLTGAFIHPDLASKLCRKIAAAMSDIDRQGFERGVQQSEKVLDAELKDLADCDWEENSEREITVRAWIMNSRARIRQLMKGGT